MRPTNWNSALDVVSDPEAVFLGGRSAKGLLQFCDLVNDLQARSRDGLNIQQVMEKSGQRIDRRWHR